MKIETSVTALFYVSVDKPTANALHFEAAHHYDGHCKSYAAPYGVDRNPHKAGLLTMWVSILDTLLSEGETEWVFRVTWQEMDTLSKICEMSRNQLVQDFAWAIHRSMLYFNDNCKKFPPGTITFGTIPLASPPEV